jgi:hypothetical protein
VHEYVVEGIDPAGDHHVAAAGDEFQKCHVNRTQRTGARRVDHAVGATQVETVADAAGDHIAEESGKGVFLPGNVGIGYACDDFFCGCCGHSRALERLPPFGEAEPGPEWNDQFLGTGDTQNDTGSFSIERFSVVVAGVRKCHLGRHKPQQLGGIGGFQGGRRYAEFGRVEHHLR